MRHESGILESICNLARDAMANENLPEQIALLAESIATKMISSPLHSHTNSLCNLVQVILQSTTAEYHKELASELFKMTEALYKELKKGG